MDMVWGIGRVLHTMIIFMQLFIYTGAGYRLICLNIFVDGFIEFPSSSPIETILKYFDKFYHMER